MHRILQKFLPLGLVIRQTVSNSHRSLHVNLFMAKSKYEYVRHFEQDDRCLPNTWIVVRIDGKGFHRFTTDHGFAKPNDAPALQLMSRAAGDVVELFRPDLVLAYGQSDEYSFVFRRQTGVHGRRMSKLMSQVVSQFSSSYVYHWSSLMGERRLLYPPTFDARVVLYPTDQNLRDYLSWRQADCHINNLYNTTFWALVNKAQLTNAQAEERIRHTVSADKNEILFSEFGINYNSESALYRKGTTIVLTLEDVETSTDVTEAEAAKGGSETSETAVDENGSEKRKGRRKGERTQRSVVKVMNCDIIGNEFWREHSSLLSGNKRTKS